MILPLSKLEQRVHFEGRLLTADFLACFNSLKLKFNSDSISVLMFVHCTL